MTQEGQRADPVRRIVDVAVFAPIGLAAIARDHLPELVETGRERVRQRLTVARFIGELVVQQGRREVSKRLESPPAAPSRPQTPMEVPETPMGVTVVDAPSAASSGAPGPASRPPEADSLPIADYESLAASQVVARLAGLDRDDLAAIEAFERAHRSRRTVLGKVEQLRSAS
jgi:hypothetical protein